MNANGRAYSLSLGVLLFVCVSGSPVVTVSQRTVAPTFASWRITSSGVEDRGLVALSGADGSTSTVTLGGSAGLTSRADASPPSNYLYFSIRRDVVPRFVRPVYAIV